MGIFSLAMYTLPSDTNKPKAIIAYNLLLDCADKPTPQLADLLTLLKVNHDGTLASIVQETQKQWLRQAGKERWQVDEVCGELKEQILSHAINLGLTNEIKPVKAHYKYGVIFTASLTRTRTRLAYLVKLFEQGTQFDYIISLGSDRPLDPAIEPVEKMLDPNNGELAFRKDWQPPIQLPKTENEMVQMVYDQSDLPEKFRSIPITFHNSAMIKNANGTITRPTTGDTVLKWLASNPAHGDCLFISNQPYVGYQDSVMRTYMPEDFGFLETCGSAAQENPQNQNLIFLDTLARFLYQEKMRREIVKKKLNE